MKTCKKKNFLDSLAKYAGQDWSSMARGAGMLLRPSHGIGDPAVLINALCSSACHAQYCGDRG